MGPLTTRLQPRKQKRDETSTAEEAPSRAAGRPGPRPPLARVAAIGGRAGAPLMLLMAHSAVEELGSRPRGTDNPTATVASQDTSHVGQGDKQAATSNDAETKIGAVDERGNDAKLPPRIPFESREAGNRK